MTTAAWGTSNTQFFYSLTPDRVLDAAEKLGFRCSGLCSALNSFENRVYLIEEEEGEERVIKFYRPGRWNEAQIREEHEFLFDLQTAEVPVCAPMKDAHGESLFKNSDGIFYTVYPRFRGRVPDELDNEKLRWLGRMIARIHTVGAQKKAHSRVKLDENSYALSHLEFLTSHPTFPIEFKTRYSDTVKALAAIAKPLLAKEKNQRIHGDCHKGNLLWNASGPYFLDFDDMVVGPPIQDLWLLLPQTEEVEEYERGLNNLIGGYEEMRPFDRSSLKLVEVLRGLRYVHFSAWLAYRFEDPAFPIAFPQFGSSQYWEGQVYDLERLVRGIQARVFYEQ